MTTTPCYLSQPTTSGRVPLRCANHEVLGKTRFLADFEYLTTGVNFVALYWSIFLNDAYSKATMTDAGSTVSRQGSLMSLRAIAAALGVIAVAFSTLILAAPAHAAGFTDGDYVYDSTSATTATIVDYTGGPVANIPATATDGTSTYTVTEIGASAFSTKSLVSATIPNTVTAIGSHAFESNLLSSIVIPDTVTSLGTYAFQWNAPLTSVTLGSGLTSVPEGAFFGCHLSSIVFPPSITSIGYQSFTLNNFATLTFPDAVTSIGDSAFSTISALTSVTFGAGLTSIGQYAFAGTGLTTVSIPASVTSIGNHAFDTNGPGMSTAVFQGAAPSTFTARSAGNGSFGDVNTTVYYSSAHAGDFTPSPWNGYNTVQGATLSFDMGGHGTAIAPVVVIPGNTAPKPTDPSATDFHFEGWFSAASGGTPFDFTASLTGDATAFAQWQSTTLAATGTEPAPWLLVGGGLLAAGLALLTVRRMSGRRRAHSAS